MNSDNEKSNEQKHDYVLVKRIKTPDGTIIESNQIHKPAFHLDKNGQKYMIYYSPYGSRIQSDGNHIDMSIWSDSPFDEIREHFTWGSYGKLGDEPLHFIKLKDMADEHVKSITDGGFGGFNGWIFEEELKWREQ